MLESLGIIGYVSCPLIKTSVMFDAAKRHKFGWWSQFHYQGKVLESIV